MSDTPSTMPGRVASQSGEAKGVTLGTLARLFLRTVGWVVLYVVLISLAAVMLMPLVWMLSTATKELGEATMLEFRLLPSRFMLWENIATAFSRQPFALYIYNSAIVAISVTTGQVLLSALAGYSFSKFRFPGRDVLFMGVLSTMMVPFFVVIIPLYIVVHTFGWLDTYLALIVPGLASAFGIFLMRQFMTSIPDELIDAARIDGAHEVRTFVQIALPLSKPALSTLAILSFMGTWDSYVWPLMVINDRRMLTLPLGLTVFRSSYITYWNELMAMSLIGILPTLTLFFIFQKQFVEGIAITGLKG